MTAVAVSAWANKPEVLTTIRGYAQEMSEDVIWPYVDLYVTDHTVDLGEDGRRALDTLERTAREAGVVEGHTAPLRIFG